MREERMQNARKSRSVLESSATFALSSAISFAESPPATGLPLAPGVPVVVVWGIVSARNKWKGRGGD
jgi:hypothetical protein